MLCQIRVDIYSIFFDTKIEHPKGPKGLFGQKFYPMQLFLRCVRQTTEAYLVTPI